MSCHVDAVCGQRLDPIHAEHSSRPDTRAAHLGVTSQFLNGACSAAQVPDLHNGRCLVVACHSQLGAHAGMPLQSRAPLDSPAGVHQCDAQHAQPHNINLSNLLSVQQAASSLPEDSFLMFCNMRSTSCQHKLSTQVLCLLTCGMCCR